MKVISHRFVSRGIGLEELLSDPSIRVIGFEYLIPRPLFPPVKRISKLYIFRENENPSSKGKIYNFFNLLFCWVGLPFGPIYALMAVKKNNKGIDLSLDFKDNINELDFKFGRVVVERTNEIFIKPDKETKNELLKAFKKYTSDNGELNTSLLIGVRIDIENPQTYIGLNSNDIENKEMILKYIYKYFYSHVKFEVVDVTQKSDLIEKLIQQGEKIKIADTT